MTDFNSENVKQAVNAAMAKLATAEHFDAATLVSMPSLYPSGASVIVEISAQRGRFFVSDRGGGAFEAELMGASRIYSKVAERISKESGVQFDGRDMFVAEATIDNVAGAMVVVAHCSQMAANFSAMKVADRVLVDAEQILYDRLVSIFQKPRVSKDAEIMGSSNHQWHVSAFLAPRSQSNDRGTVFDAVANHPTSAVWTAAKFGDLARLDLAPRRIAVVQKREIIGDMLGVIAPFASAVIEIEASNDIFMQLEAA